MGVGEGCAVRLRPWLGVVLLLPFACVPSPLGDDADDRCGEEDARGEDDPWLAERRAVARRLLLPAVSAGVRVGDDAVFLTAEGMACLGPGAKVRWAGPLL